MRAELTLRRVLDHGYKNDVSSAGAPIWATSRLNALKLPIVLGLLHTQSNVADADHPATRRYRRLLSSFENRNLVLASLDPDIHETLGLRQFATEQRGRDAETVLWRTPTPDDGQEGAGHCPDCGGTGDISDSMGRFTTTVPMPRNFGEHRYSEPVKPHANT